ncbi:MAG TPA: glycosyltransferase family 4 protein [Acidimicrobiales bacterium]
MPALHQFTPTLDAGAVGAHLLEIQRTLRQAGWESEVFSEHTRAPYEGRAHRFTEYGRSLPAHPDDVVVYHTAIGSSVADWLMSQRPRRLVVDYHNITPPSWFEGWNDNLAYGLGWGRAQLRRLARRSRFGLADSAFNARELDAVGFRRTAVLPILVPAEALGGEPDPALLGRLRGRPVCRWLFVGRLAPNKCQHRLIAALAAFRRAYRPDAELVLVGGASAPAYEDALRRYAADLGLSEAVTFAGTVSDADRNAYYAAADVFVCLSAHEGFCVPLLEAWYHRVPVVAYAATAVPETLGRAGVLLPTASPLTVAAAVARVTGDPVVAGGLREAGRARLGELSLERAEARLLELADALATGAADRPAPPTALAGPR